MFYVVSSVTQLASGRVAGKGLGEAAIFFKLRTFLIKYVLHENHHQKCGRPFQVSTDGRFWVSPEAVIGSSHGTLRT